MSRLAAASGTGGDVAFDGGLLLALNCGSSSVKFALFDADLAPLPRRPLWGGQVDALKSTQPLWKSQDEAAQPVTIDAAQPYASALALIDERLRQRFGARRTAAVVHRVVHGGSKYFEPVRMNPAILAELRECIPLAPLHQPFALAAIEAMFESHPGLPQVACFDTAFHHSMPQQQQMLPLSWQAWQRGIRRYGFHGLSYDYVAQVLGERHGERARGRSIIAHLGSGASLCALHELRSFSTTMGFSALDGLMMGTRCGALDPGALLYLMEADRLTPAQLSQLLYRESGLLGVSGVSDDTRVLLEREADDERCRLALALYVDRIVRDIGGLAALLGGLDLLAFTAGVGEHNAVIRERVCGALAFLGARLDPAANQAHAPTISMADSKVLLAVVPTNEEWVAASQALRLLRSG